VGKTGKKKRGTGQDRPLEQKFSGGYVAHARGDSRTSLEMVRRAQGQETVDTRRRGGRDGLGKGREEVLGKGSFKQSAARNEDDNKKLGERGKAASKKGGEGTKTRKGGKEGPQCGKLVNAD